MKFNMEFFNNKRLMVILSGVASILVALMIFVMSLIGFDNISAFMFGSGKPVETPSSVSTPTPEITPPINQTAPTPQATTQPNPTVPQDSPTASPSASPLESPTPASQEPVEVLPVSLKINEGTSVELLTGKQKQLNVTISPSNVTNRTVTWTSTATNIAMVDQTGLVIAIAPGTAYITAKTANNMLAQIVINVKPSTVAVTNVVITGKTGIQVTEKTMLTANIEPLNATDKKVTWFSNNESVAVVNENGLVTALAEGTVTISATVGGVTGRFDITVFPAAAG